MHCRRERGVAFRGFRAPLEDHWWHHGNNLGTSSTATEDYSTTGDPDTSMWSNRSQTLGDFADAVRPACAQYLDAF